MLTQALDSKTEKKIFLHVFSLNFIVGIAADSLFT